MAVHETLTDAGKNVRLFENKGIFAVSKKLGKFEFTLESLSVFELWMSRPRNLCFYER